MPIEDLPYDQFIVKWTWYAIFLNAMVGYFYGSVGIYFIFVALNIVNEISLAVSLIVAVVFIPVIGYRNRIINKILGKKTNQKAYLTLELIQALMVLVFFMLALILYFISKYKITHPYLQFDVFIFLAALTIYFPIYLMFFRAISKNGKVHLEFLFLFENIADFTLRQRYLRQIFVRVENKLKRGRISISPDRLLYYFNLALFQYQDDFTLRTFLDDSFVKLERWLVNDEIAGLINSLDAIIPITEFKALERISLIRSISPNTSEIIRYVFLIVVILILAFSHSIYQQILSFF